MKKRVLSFVLALMLLIPLVAGVMTVRAGTGPYGTLLEAVTKGEYMYVSGSKQYDFTTTRYALEGGGYAYYNQLWNTAVLTDQTAHLFTTTFESLKPGDKRKFLENAFTIANAMAADTAHGVFASAGQADAPTDDTVQDLMNAMSQEAGAAGMMLSAILSQTKPNYVAANRIFEPFSGVFGTALGLIAILIMAFLGVTIALDIAYITIPAFQVMLGSTDEKGDGKTSKGIGGFISQEAKNAVQAAAGGQGGQAGNGEYKAAVGVYFKYRWKGLLLLGICLLYLVQGQIYSFVGWFIDLFSGFLGF